MELADRGAADYLASEVLAKAPARVRDLIVRTSMVDEVSRDFATAVLGVGDVALDPAEASEAFLELRSDGSFTCDPLIRAAALSQLAREPRELPRRPGAELRTGTSLAATTTLLSRWRLLRWTGSSWRAPWWSPTPSPRS